MADVEHQGGESAAAGQRPAPRASPRPHSPLAPSMTSLQAAAPPTERPFPSREALLAYVHEFSVSHGYAVVTQKSNVPRGQLWLRCDLGGSSKPGPTLRKRKGGTARRKNCPFQLYARRLPSSNWVLKVQHAAHNHAAAADAQQLAAHPIARRLSLEQKRLVRELTAAGVRPARILERLKERFPEKPFKVQDIYNTRNFIRPERLAGRVAFARQDNQEWLEAAGRVQSRPPPPAAAAAFRLPSPSPPSAAAVEQLGPSESAVFDVETRLRETWRRVNCQFPTWQRDVQMSFAQQLELLLETCGRATEGHERQSRPSDEWRRTGSADRSRALYDSSVAMELGAFARAPQPETDVFLPGSMDSDDDFDAPPPPMEPSETLNMADVLSEAEEEEDDASTKELVDAMNQ